MASNQTANYGLSQLEATDQVVRMDFNSDNEKIDAALHGMAQTYAADIEELRESQWWGKILEKTLTSDTTSVTLTIPDPGTWQMLSLQFSVSGPTYVRISLNNGAGFYYNYSDGEVTEHTIINSSSSALTASGCKMEFYQGSGNSLYAFYQVAYIGSEYSNGSKNSGASLLTTDLPLANLTQIKLTSTGNFNAGSRFAIYGLKQ